MTSPGRRRQGIGWDGDRARRTATASAFRVSSPGRRRSEHQRPAEIPDASTRSTTSREGRPSQNTPSTETARCRTSSANRSSRHLRPDISHQGSSGAACRSTASRRSSGNRACRFRAFNCPTIAWTSPPSLTRSGKESQRSCAARSSGPCTPTRLLDG